MNSSFYNDLALIKKDEKQWSAFKATGSTVLIAGPGSGKTRVLSLKAVVLAQTAIQSPSGLACISFSREAVRELKTRLRQYGYSPGSKDFIGTVHSFSLLHVIQPFAHLFSQYGVKYPVRLLPNNIRNKIYSGVLGDLNTNDHILSFGSIARHRALSLTGVSKVNIRSTDLVEQGALKFEQRLFKTEYLDFTAIINIAAAIIREQEFVRKALQSKFPWLLVDEYQDLGKPLHEMVLELVFNAHMKLYAVGDENQSIYGFTGGYPDFLRELTQYDDLTTIYLASNYRSSQHIIEASLEALQPGPPKPQYDAKRRKDEADFTFITCEEEMYQQFDVVAKKVIPKLTQQGITFNEIAIITGSNAEANHMAGYLKAQDIPFFIAKWQFENSAVAEWLQDCALWCVDNSHQPFDELFRFWQRTLAEHGDDRRLLPAIQVKTLLYGILDISKDKTDVYEWVTFLIDGLGLAYLFKDSEIYPNEVENLQNIQHEAKTGNLKNAPLQRFAKLNTPDNEVTVTTRHSSKGLEFEVVILLGMEEGRFPHYTKVANSAELGEEQRLCYVCVSRAKKGCILLMSKVYNFTGKWGDYQRKYEPSRFWTALHQKFGTQANSYTSQTY